MFKKMNLQTRIMSAFIIMGLIVLIVGSVGWSSTSRLNKYIDDLLGNAVPSLIGFWQINQGQTNIQSAERLLFAPNITQEKRQIALAQIAQGWQLINEGTKQYETTPFNDKEEKQQYQKFKQNLDAWKQSHQRFLEIEREFGELGIPNPWERLADLLRRGIKENSPEMNAVKTALASRTKMDVEVAAREEPLYKIAKEDAQQLLKGNDDLKEEVHKGAEQEVSRSTFWVILGMTIGPLTAIILGIVLSLAIAKPLDKALQGIINMIVSSSTEIGVTVEQQERIASEQATSVNQTTITMEELRASARQAADQAESATENARQVLNLAEEGATGARQVLNLAESGSTGARQVLNLAEEGTTVVGKTLEGMSELKEKVGAIAQQITRLNDQTAQIGSITSAVTDIANQTNMLALNAAVEAVRAGEHGKGFGVVATEIRRLADQSKKSAEKINAIISEIQNAMNSTVLVTDEGTKTVGEGIKLSNDTAQAFRGVVQAINDVVLKNQQMTLTAINDVVLKNQQMTLTAINDIVVKNQQISFTAKQQAVAVQQVVDAMNTLNVGAQQTATGITQTKEGIQKINDAALNLKALV